MQGPQLAAVRTAPRVAYQPSDLDMHLEMLSSCCLFQRSTTSQAGAATLQAGSCQCTASRMATKRAFLQPLVQLFCMSERCRCVLWASEVWFALITALLACKCKQPRTAAPWRWCCQTISQPLHAGPSAYNTGSTVGVPSKLSTCASVPAPKIGSNPRFRNAEDAKAASTPGPGQYSYGPESIESHYSASSHVGFPKAIRDANKKVRIWLDLSAVLALAFQYTRLHVRICKT